MQEKNKTDVQKGQKMCQKKAWFVKNLFIEFIESK